MRDQVIGIGLALFSSICIGASVVFTKKGHIEALKSNKQKELEYLKTNQWWIGAIFMTIGEIANFLAYMFASPIIVTPLGILSVIIGTVLASIFLNEKVELLGKIGSGISLLGVLQILIHSESREFHSFEEVKKLFTSLFFASYIFAIIVLCLILNYKVIPIKGNETSLYHILICSSIGSVSVIALKGVGAAVTTSSPKNNYFSDPALYLFIFCAFSCMIVQLKFLNIALLRFNSAIVNNLYYVCFTSFTLSASFLFLDSFFLSSLHDNISTFLGFLVIVLGSYILTFVTSISQSNKNSLSLHV